MGIDLSGWEARSNERASSPDQDSINLRIGRKVSSELKIPNLLNLAHAFLQISQFHFIRAARWSARRGPCLEIPVIDKGISSVSDAIYQTSQSLAVPIPYDPASSIAICNIALLRPRLQSSGPSVSLVLPALVLVCLLL